MAPSVQTPCVVHDTSRGSPTPSPTTSLFQHKTAASPVGDGLGVPPLLQQPVCHLYRPLGVEHLQAGSGVEAATRRRLEGLPLLSGGRWPQLGRGAGGGAPSTPTPPFISASLLRSADGSLPGRTLYGPEHASSLLLLLSATQQELPQ